MSSEAGSKESFESQFKAALAEMEKGDSDAKVKVAWFKLSGLGGCPVDKEGAVALLEQERKNPEAQWMLGLCREFGMGTAQNLEEAKNLYRESEKHGNLIGELLEDNSCMNLGSKEVHLRSNITKCGVKVLAIAPWTSLSLSNDRFTDGIKGLVDGLVINTCLTKLSLEGCFIMNDACYFKEVLKANKTLKTIDLSRNELGSWGLEDISEGLKENSTLRSLNLDGNSIRGDGMKALAEALKINSTLTSINLKRNPFADEGAKAIGEALKYNVGLTDLCLQGQPYNRFSKIEDEGAIAIAEGLKVNSTLRRLDLSYHRIEAEGAKKIWEAKGDTCVNLSMNNIDKDVGHDLGIRDCMDPKPHYQPGITTIHYF